MGQDSVQDVLSFLTVAFVMGWLGLRAIRATVGNALALWLLNHGVSARWAMKLRSSNLSGACGGCSCDSKMNHSKINKSFNPKVKSL